MIYKSDFGWYAAGWMVFQSGKVFEGFIPPLQNIKAVEEWVDGFRDAWIASVDEGGMVSGVEELLFEIAPVVFRTVHDHPEVFRGFGNVKNINRTEWRI